MYRVTFGLGDRFTHWPFRLALTPGNLQSDNNSGVVQVATLKASLESNSLRPKLLKPVDRWVGTGQCPVPVLCRSAKTSFPGRKDHSAALRGPFPPGRVEKLAGLFRPPAPSLWPRGWRRLGVMT